MYILQYKTWFLGTWMTWDTCDSPKEIEEEKKECLKKHPTSLFRVLTENSFF